MYVTGKGNHLLSCMIPKDCVPGIKLLVNSVTRGDVGVLIQNKFLFPDICSVHHCIGCDALNTMIKQ